MMVKDKGGDNGGGQGLDLGVLGFIKGMTISKFRLVGGVREMQGC